MKVATYRCSCQQPWNITKIICHWHRTTLLASGISGTGRSRKVRNIIIIIARRYVFSGSQRKKIVCKLVELEDVGTIRRKTWGIYDFSSDINQYHICIGIKYLL